MKGLILSITTGQGHNQTAKVMSDRFYESGIDCPYLDALKYINPILSESVQNLYLMSSKTLPKIYGKIYNKVEDKNGNELKGIPKITNKLLAHRLIDMIHSENPDFIICTHVFSALLITSIKKHINPNIITLGIITDFTIHPYWEDTRIDYYITPTATLSSQGMRRGIPTDKLVPLGIPIDRKFSTKTSQSDARKALNIKDKRTILVMSGSMGFGNIISELKALDRTPLDFQILNVCGNNKKLKKKVDKLTLEKDIYNFGYVNNVDIMMDAADCIITKPGGLTTSEALAKQLPMIMSNPVPGHEDRNVEFLLNAGVAIKTSATYPIEDAINQLFTENRLSLIKEAILEVGKPNATNDLAEFIIKNVK